MIGKKIIIFIVCFATGLLSQPLQTSSTENTTGGQSSSAGYNLVGSAGQPAPPGQAMSSGYNIYGGYIATILSTVDITAPAAPVGLNTTPGGWTNVNDFEVYWSSPPGDETIAGAWYKLYDAPTGPDDGTYVDGNRLSISGISVTEDGEHSVYVWLKDLAGNYTHLNNSETILKYDGTPPHEIQHTPVSSATVNQNIDISASTVDDLSGLKAFRVYARMTGDVGQDNSFDFEDGLATIPAYMNTQRGVEYYIQAEDSAGNKTRYPEIGYLSIQVEVIGEGGFNTTASGDPVIQHNGSNVSDYRIFSVPFVLNNKKPSAVFEDDLGTFDDTQWKLFDVAGGTIRDYLTMKDLDIVLPGKGFLLIVNMSEKYVDAGEGQSPEVASYKTIQLSSGWNLVGNPFDFDIPLDSLKVDGTTPECWYLGSGGWTNSVTHLKKWEGLAIVTTSNTTLEIGVATGSGAKKQVSDLFTAEDWGLRVSAIGEQSQDMDNYLGVYTPGRKIEKTNWYEPPRLSNAVSLRLVAEQNKLSKPVFAGQHHYSTIIQEKTEDGLYWDLELRGDIEDEQVVLEFAEFGEIPVEYKRILVDKNLGIAYDLTETGNQLSMDNNKDLRFIAGNESFAKANSMGISLYPEDFAIKKVYPNPFNPATSILFTLPQSEKISIEVYTILGERVRTLVKDKLYQAGYHTIKWDGHNEHGMVSGSGMYIFRIRSGSQQRIVKGILIK